MSNQPIITEPAPLGEILQEVARKLKRKEAIRFANRRISYGELDKSANRVANGLKKLGIKPGDRVALMLPNIPEFIYCFYGIQKLGATAVPFNAMYKGREIAYILNDCGARAIILLANFVSLLDEIRDEVPALEQVILAGQRTLVFVSPEATVNVQFVVEKSRFTDGDEAFRRVGEMLEKTLHDLGAHEAWYKHRGSIRARGRKLATILVSEIENLYVINTVCFLGPLKTEDFFKVIWVTPEVKDKVVEPLTSVEELTGKRPSLESFRDAFAARLEESFGETVEPGDLKRDELFGYEKTRALAYRK
ncbi:long-chain acyl-CoA synthetase [Alkalispirochaeta americana]|uniref:Long-chain acyl-CoA synthetase n=1 Tax=Alkalispirochaeta americana TaxID=159291 RepID=A0A1N6N8Q1_9SPIO|nr:AMP-binding protein [Alkalispirochaeta americana]SIP88449.1 long-chain acyl-CoA synthetase [Alkalispirochaeta americana]